MWQRNVKWILKRPRTGIIRSSLRDAPLIFRECKYDLVVFSLDPEISYRTSFETARKLQLHVSDGIDIWSLYRFARPAAPQAWASWLESPAVPQPYAWPREIGNQRRCTTTEMAGSTASIRKINEQSKGAKVPNLDEQSIFPEEYISSESFVSAIDMRQQCGSPVSSAEVDPVAKELAALRLR